MRDVSHVLRSLSHEITVLQVLHKIENFRTEMKMKMKMKVEIKIKMKEGVVMCILSNY